MIVDATSKVHLFNVNLLLATRERFRKAIKKAGAPPLRENDRYWYDKYDSSHLLDGTDILYAGYVERTGKLAIVEYRFPTRMNTHKIVEVKDMLASKYGSPDTSSGNPDLGSVSFTWDQSLVKIVVKRGWPDTTVYLDYIVKDAKEKMDAEVAENERKQKQKKCKTQSSAF